jgi:hypothetical protein
MHELDRMFSGSGSDSRMDEEDEAMEKEEEYIRRRMEDRKR